MNESKEIFHVPVLVEQVCSFLIWDKNGIYVDGTVGGGGHSILILNQLAANAKLIGIDQDEDALRNVKERVQDTEKRFIIKRGNFQNIDKLVSELGYDKVHGIFLDLGVSSYQIDTAARGFSYRFDGPLDMRMSSGNTLTAKAVINSYAETELARIFREYGEEKLARAIARRIVRERRNRVIESTRDLKDIVVAVVPGRYQVKSLSRIFLALRIEINKELSVLETALQASLSQLTSGGRLVVLTYHSLEDRIVKQFFKREEEECICPPQFPECVCGKVKRIEILTKKPISPDDAEVLANPRARSAKLRAAMRCVNN